MTSPRLYARLPIPNAAESDPETYRAEVAALVRVLRNGCRGPKGEEPSQGQIAALIGVGRTTLSDWTAELSPVRRGVANPSFTAVYALRALAAAPVATQRALWGHDGAE